MYLLLIVSIVFATLNNVALQYPTKTGKGFNPFLFNIIVALVWVPILFIYNAGIQSATVNTFVFGLLYGLVFTGFIFFKCKAMSNGPISITALIGCSSFVITTIFNAIYWKESIGFFEAAGIVVALIAIILSNIDFKRNSRQKETSSLKWKIYSLFFFLFAGSTGIIFRFHQNVDAENTNEMMIIAASVSVLILFAIWLIGGGLKKTEENKKTQFDRVIFIVALVCGILSCVYNRLNIYLAGAMPSVLFFPIFNCSVILLSLCCGCFNYKEKLTLQKTVGVFLGVVAVSLISRFFGIC